MRPSADGRSGTQIRRSAAGDPAAGHDPDDRDHVDPGVRRLTKAPNDRDLIPLELSRLPESARALDGATTPRGDAARVRTVRQGPRQAGAERPRRGGIGIDHVPRRSRRRRYEHRQPAVLEINCDLQVLARELHLPVIALPQLSRDVDTRRPPIPILSDLSGSGALKQDADLV